MASGHKDPHSLPSWAEDLLPHLVDKRASISPNSICAEYPVSNLDYDQGYRKITFAQLANAVNGAAWWLHRTLGTPRRDSETLAYIGPFDVRYPVLLLGAVKAGYTLFLTSPRNSLAAHLNLLHRLDCKNLLAPAVPHPVVSSIAEEDSVAVVNVPEVEYLLNDIHDPYIFEKGLAESLEEPLFIVHTSGSTGMPKPIIYTHASAIANMKMITLEPPPGYESQDRMFQGNRVFMTLPPFHGASIVSFLFNTIPFATTLIAPVSDSIPSGQGLVAGLRKAPADVAFVVPSIVQDLAHDANLLDYCAKHLKVIFYCGGDLPQSIGDTVASQVRLVNQYGATELGLTPNLLSLTCRDRMDWRYVQFHPHLGLQFKLAADNTYELFAVRNQSLEEYQPTFTLFPQLQEYGTRDLFVRHPSSKKSDMWRWKARADDIIVFLNGEKTNPISMEQHIVSGVPEVSAALVIGAQRFQAALLIEPVEKEKGYSASERAAFIENMWPVIEEANGDAPSHARIMKSHILFTRQEKRMIRAGKGTIQRAATLNTFADDINALYRDAERLSTEETTAKDDCILDETSISQIIEKTVLSITSWPDLQESLNLFTAGMDSLHAILLVRALRQNFHLHDLAPSTLYINPSIASLSRAISVMQSQRQISQTAKQQAHIRKRDALLQEYRSRIDQIQAPSARDDAASSNVVVLTGSTGALGSFILDNLLKDRAITHIYCLNRAAASEKLQKERNQRRGIFTDWSSDRTTFSSCDLSRPDLGLPVHIYDGIINSNVTIIHSAWPVDFNLSIDSFRPQLAGVVNLIRLASISTQTSHLCFISSISSVMVSTPHVTAIPECAVQFYHNEIHLNGYAESKYLSELLLQHASEKLSVRTTVARVGQLTGPTGTPAVWNPAEWFPSLVISSAHLGALPDALGAVFDNIDWVPIDLAAQAIVDLSFGSKDDANSATVEQYPTTPATFCNVVNPKSLHWQQLRHTVVETLSHYTDKPVELIEPRIWLQRVREDIEGSSTRQKATHHDDQERVLEQALRLNPAAKLLDFYEDTLGCGGGEGVRWEMRETLRRSRTLRGGCAGGVGEEMGGGVASSIKCPGWRRWMRKHWS